LSLRNRRDAFTPLAPLADAGSAALEVDARRVEPHLEDADPISDLAGVSDIPG